MKRLIPLCTLLLLFISSCDSPMGDLNSGNQHQVQPDHVLSGIPPGTPADSIQKVAWQQFKNQHGPKWRVTWNELEYR